MRFVAGAVVVSVCGLLGSAARADVCSASPGNTVNLRGGPGTGYGIQSTLSGSASLPKLGVGAAGAGCSTSWVALSYGGRSVYACGTYLACRASTPPAGDIRACSLQGRFRAIVASVLGASLVGRATYGLMIVQKTSPQGRGAILCEEYSNGDLTVTPASTIKTLVAVAALRKVDAGAVRLSDAIAITQPNAAAECADWGCGSYGPGRRVTVQKLIADMITVSNNLATNQLVDLVGKPFIADTAARLDARGVVLNRKVYSVQNPEPTNPNTNQSTAYGMARIYRELATGRLGVLSDASRALLVEYLRQDVFHDRLDKLFPPSIPFMHKIGNTSTLSGDAGFYNLGSNTAVVLVGHQAFVSYPTLQQIGKKTLDLTLSLR